MALTLTNTDNVDDSEGSNFELASVFGVTTAVVGGRTLLFTAAQADNGVSVFELAATGTLTSVRDEPDRGDLELLGASSVATADIGGQVFLFAASLDDGGMSSFAVLGNGALLNTDNEDDATDAAFELGGALAVTTAVAAGRTFAFVAGFSDDGVSVFEVSVEGTLIHRDSVDDVIDAPQELNGARGLATAVIGGTTYLYVAGGVDNGISVFEFDPNDSVSELTNVQNLSSNPDLLLNPFALATAVVGAKTFLFAPSFSGDGVSVFEIAANGTLTNVENVVDNATLQIAGAGSVHTAKIAGTTYLFVSGLGDDGVSVFAVAADGSLINFTNVTDDPTLELNNARSMSTATVDGNTFLVVGGEFDNGVSVFRIETTGVTINGTNGNDVIDALNAPPGELLPSDLGDTLFGGLGKDTMSGGAGGDFFDFNVKTESTKGANRDVILDFSHAEGDRIDLAGIDAKSGVGGNQRFTFIGKQGFHHEKGELHFIKKAGFVVVEGDTNGDGRPDFQIQVDDIAKLVAGDFVR